MLRAIGLLLMGVAMLSILGGHWAILQAVAWSQMLRDYAKDAPLSTAVVKTFDGKHPCPLCLKIARGKREQEKNPLALKIEKRTTVFVLNAGDALKHPVSGDFAFPPGKTAFHPARNSAPPVPVPILAFA
ncbi:MAG: hypothetical protein PHC88_13960 [Terrimicrobiaceae bacterium]|nr:hypothetical protein [Terrimicrobiaceae bacterium]